MKIPKTITVGGLKIRIKIVRQMPESLGLDDDKLYLGYADLVSGNIYLLRRPSLSAMEHTLWHELAHFIWFLVYPNCPANRYPSESQTELLANSIKTIKMEGNQR